MRVFKYVYHHNGSILCTEYVQDSITHKIKLEMEMSFYRVEDGEWITEYDYMLPMCGKLTLKMKMSKIVNDEIHYESLEVLDEYTPRWDEW